MYIISAMYPKEKKALLYNANGLLYPSLLEGFGLVLLEAARFYCPMLTSKDTVCEEVASHFTNNQGGFIDPTSDEGLVKVYRPWSKQWKVLASECSARGMIFERNMGGHLRVLS